MLTTISQFVVLALGLFVCLFAVAGMAMPQKVMNSARAMISANWLIYAAVIGRLILGTTLIIASSVSRFPTIFQVLGWVSITAAIVIAFIGRERLCRFIDWFFERSSISAVRMWMLLALAFGGFLIYGIS